MRNRFSANALGPLVLAHCWGRNLLADKALRVGTRLAELSHQGSLTGSGCRGRITGLLSKRWYCAVNVCPTGVFRRNVPIMLGGTLPLDVGRMS